MENQAVDAVNLVQNGTYDLSIFSLFLEFLTFNHSIIDLLKIAIMGLVLLLSVFLYKPSNEDEDQKRSSNFFVTLFTFLIIFILFIIIAQLHIDDMKSPNITNLTTGSALKNKEKMDRSYAPF